MEDTPGRATSEKPAQPEPSMSKTKPKNKVQSMRSKSPAKKEAPGVDTIMTAADDDAMQTDSSLPKPKPKKARKARKSNTGGDGGKYVPPKDEPESSDADVDDDKPRRKKRKSV